MAWFNESNQDYKLWQLYVQGSDRALISKICTYFEGSNLIKNYFRHDNLSFLMKISYFENFSIGTLSTSHADAIINNMINLNDAAGILYDAMHTKLKAQAIDMMSDEMRVMTWHETLRHEDETSQSGQILYCIAKRFLLLAGRWYEYLHDYIEA